MRYARECALLRGRKMNLKQLYKKRSAWMLVSVPIIGAVVACGGGSESATSNQPEVELHAEASATFPYDDPSLN
jgi:hypothetical protein